MNRYLKAAYLFGIIGGIFCALAFIVFYVMGAEPVSFTEIFGYLIIPVFVFVGIKNFKDDTNRGELTFSQGMTVGFFVYSVLALISAMFIFIMLHWDPSIFDNFRLTNLSVLEEKRGAMLEQLGEGSYELTLDNIEHMTVFDVVLDDFLRKLIPGLFFTIIISILLKNSKN